MEEEKQEDVEKIIHPLGERYSSDKVVLIRGIRVIRGSHSRI